MSRGVGFGFIEETIPWLRSKADVLQHPRQINGGMMLWGSGREGAIDTGVSGKKK